MTAFEPVCKEEDPTCVIVVGDVNSTLACAIVAKKLSCQVAHVEAGLRSGGRSMPEEINRIATDSITDLFFVTEPSGAENLRKEGQPEANVFFVGHVMIDNLFYEIAKLESGAECGEVVNQLRGRIERYGVVTLHRPSNVDDERALRGIAGALNHIAKSLTLVFSVHPRTRKRIEEFGISFDGNIHLTEPLGYRDFLSLWCNAEVVLTDSGGLQEETTAAGVPCLTIREKTERPIALTEGTNTLVGADPSRIVEAAVKILSGPKVLSEPRRPEFWDGMAADRILDQLAAQFAG